MDIPDMNPDLATAEEVTAQAEAVAEESAQVSGKGWSRTTQG